MTDGVPAETKIAALERLREEIQTESVQETELADLYAEVTTSPAQLWNRATAFVTVQPTADGADETNDVGTDETASGADGANGTDDEAADGPDDEEAIRAEAVVTDVSKLARGWWAPEIVDDCDAMVTVDVTPGLPAERFVQLAVAEIDDSIEAIRSDGTDDRGPPI
ncbi:hypothetical protein [Halovivax limisalsi]|uniref:hypothetical protein n=1 Tax=Halovivax limisalsi TaxID=1453760 RepID=UPI001FFC7081|nr:hypothetical protein [Halovivax limisalsi]